MTEHSQYAIYVTEQKMQDTSGDEPKFWHHTALWLVHEENGEASVVQQLHFNDYSDDFWGDELGTSKMVPNVRMGLCSSQDPDSMMMTAVKRGSEGEMLSYWNHMLEFSVDVRKKNLQFDLQNSHLPHANNCRAGVIAAAKTIGVDYDERLYADDGGTLGSRITPGRVMTAIEVGADSVEQKWVDNAALVKALPAPWDVKKLQQTSAIHRVPLGDAGL